MPEGDTVLRTARRLHQALAGRELLAADLRWPGLSEASLAGRTVTDVVARGKHLLLRLDAGWTLHSHLRMEGQWRIEATPAAGRTVVGAARRFRVREQDLRVVLVTEPWTALGLRLGMLDLVPTTSESSLVGHLGPDLLADDFAATLAAANLAAGVGPVGAALLDQRNLAGLGTMWASETLFAEGVNPGLPVAGLDVPALARLVDRARRLLASGVRHAVPSSTGSRRADSTTWVHGRLGRPCRRCGTVIRVATVGPPTQERLLSYCPGCQGGLAPGDNGGPVAPLGSAHGRGGYRRS
ncbi:MAG TPA: DNA-formamidopyrimidine glycosylase family protein [Propionicimonas sp.]|nr:DNA-formamidopyrimidine glycosylase family protein [Propionicimonas sp.]